MHTFHYATPPFDHQRKVFDQTKDYQYYAFFWEMGTGKSKVTIDTIQHLYCEGNINGAIITAEKGYYRNWQLNEFEAHWPKDIPIRIHLYTSYYTLKSQAELNAMLTPIPGVFDVVIINIETLSQEEQRGHLFCNDFIASHQGVIMVVDESTTIKSVGAKRTKVVTKIGQRCAYRRILTGTPITQSPLDLYTQCEFLKKGILGFASFTGFRSFYSIQQPIQIGPGRTIMQVVGFRDMDDLAARIQPFSSRLLKSDCLDLPEKVYTPIYVPPTKDQEKHILQLRAEAMTLVGQGLVTTENALSVLTKSLQIAGGHVKDDMGNVRRIECNKAEVLKQLITDIPDDKKIIVWGYFQEDMAIIQEALKDVCPVFEVSGRISDMERVTNIDLFKQIKRKAVFLASPRVAGKSLTLTEAEYSIYYSNGFNLEHRLQSEDRNHRIGQKNTVTYFDLVCLGTPDPKVVQALKAKEVLSRSVLDQLVAYFD